MIRKPTQPRFKKVYRQGDMLESTEIWVDLKTGVNYLFRSEDHIGLGITVLVDETGKPIISKTTEDCIYIAKNIE